MSAESWSTEQIWNSITFGREPSNTPRSYVRASEIGHSLIDVYLKMKGTPQTNPPNDRSRRKFWSGRMWHRKVEIVYRLAGILQECEMNVNYQYEGLVEVHGRLDFIAGGLPDPERFRFEVEKPDIKLLFDEEEIAFYTAFVDGLAETYPKELESYVIDIKSCSAFMFEYYNLIGKGADHHILQLYHYIKALNRKQGRLVYLCKDDNLMFETAVFNPSRVEDHYRDWIARITHYYSNGIQPPLEAMTEYRPEVGKFYTNWKVKYSPYIKMLYGFESQFEYEETWNRKVALYNRVFKRAVTGAKMTKLNEEVLAEIRKDYPNLDELIGVARSKGIFNKDEDNETD